jgi:2-C-methyl-D-erythritol 4-phosphate cytidylyltransferase
LLPIMSKTCAIVPAAGSGVRMGCGKPKQFLELDGCPILAHTLTALSRAPFISDIFLIVPEKFMPATRDIVSDWKAGCTCNNASPDISIFSGGVERQDSVLNGLTELPPECEWVLIHDGVRPFPSKELLLAVWERARATGASIAALPATDTVKRGQAGIVIETLSRNEIWLVQTPQVFRKEIILNAYHRAAEESWSGTDDASFVEWTGIPVGIVPGERSNIKVTTPEDLDWARWFLSRLKERGE